MVIFNEIFRYRYSVLKSSIHFRENLNQRPVMYPGGAGISQDQMPLYINCTEVTHIYTNGSYQLIYQNSTPLFVHTKQVFYHGDIWVSFEDISKLKKNKHTKKPAKKQKQHTPSLLGLLNANVIFLF